MASSASETASDFVEDIPMTQKFRWLAAFALLLAFGAGAAARRKSKKKSRRPLTPPPSYCRRPILWGLSRSRTPPHAVRAALLANLRLLLPVLRRTTPADDTQYVVTTKIVHASPDGDCDEMMSPKITVFCGQTANVLAQDVQSAEGQHDGVGLMIQVTKQDKQVHLNLGVEESSVCYVAPAGQPSRMTMRMQTASNVTLGKMKRLVFTKNSNGSDAEWAEVMVTEIASEDGAEGSPLDCLNDAIGDLIDTVADVATSLFGDDEVEPVASPRPTAVAAAPLYLQAPPLYYAVPAEAPCPAVKQCVAVETVKKTVRHMRIAASHGNKGVEFSVSDDDKGWKGTADRITLRNGNLVLEGHVHMASSDGADEILMRECELESG